MAYEAKILGLGIVLGGLGRVFLCEFLCGVGRELLGGIIRFFWVLLGWVGLVFKGYCEGWDVSLSFPLSL